MVYQHTIPKPGELSEAGKRVYKEKLQAILEPDHIGEFVAIEPDSERYFLGHSASEALVAARDAMPESLFFLARVGYPAAHKLGGGYGVRNRLD
ncbi:MAG: hypothetical protein DMF74_07170 [Acidobacteria bacterium]|nr:MAG: hypothetical protein DMF74_07170 [Acidobacteriota bacterium]